MARTPEQPSGFEAEGIPDMGYTLDSKEITGDPQEGMEPPRDVAIAVDDYGTTAREEAAGEPHDLRISREEPDVLDSVDLDADESEGAETPFGTETGVGRLVEPDQGASSDLETDAIASDVGTDGGGYTAEESAMHIEYEA